MTNDYYDILEINKQASDEEIRKAYRKLARKYHPDVNKEPGAEKKFKEITEAYEILSNPEKKEQYDMFGSASGKSSPFEREYDPGDWQGNFDYKNPFADILDMFGGKSAFEHTYTAPQVEISITLEEAYNGSERTIVVQGDKIKIKIPKGIANESVLRIDKKNILIKVNVLPHAIFERKENDLIRKVEISFKQAILGDQIKVQTLGGTLSVKIPEEIQNGTKLKIRGKGMSSVNGSDKGDLYVEVLVKTPKNLTKEQKKIIQQLDI